MGDRCWLEMTFRKEDLSKVKQCFDGPFWDEEHQQQEDPFFHVSGCECNYALINEREALAEEGVIFTGRHAAGGDYGAYAFVSVGGEHVEVNTDVNGSISAHVDEDTFEIPWMEMKNIKHYVELKKKAEAYLQEIH